MMKSEYYPWVDEHQISWDIAAQICCQMRHIDCSADRLETKTMTKRLRRWVALSDDEDTLPYHLDEQGISLPKHANVSRTRTSHQQPAHTRCRLKRHVQSIPLCYHDLTRRNPSRFYLLFQLWYSFLFHRGYRYWPLHRLRWRRILLTFFRWDRVFFLRIWMMDHCGLFLCWMVFWRV